MSVQSGLTVDIGDSDEHGRVNHVWIGIQYSPKVSADNVEVTFATSINAWAIRMGDGTYLRVSNPTIISKTETNTILQFDLERPYASNSPCQLVYRTELAWINIKEV
ncbi:MAG: hypothetical protein K2N48_07360 [Muribaculaceae bacterium]|nr:hypothetical protein [Muribaculaceae bacterium]